MIKRIVALAVMFVALMAAAAAPATAQQYPPGENLLTVSDAAPCPGETVTVTAQTFAAGATVTVKLGDTAVGTPTAGADGKVSLELTIPAGQAQGPVQISATGPGSDNASLTVNASADIVACNETPPPTTPGGGGGGGGGLPKTGSDNTMTLVRVGVALAAVGGLLLAVSAKRRRRTDPAPA